MNDLLCTVGVIALTALSLAIIFQRIPTREVLTTATGVLLLVILTPAAITSMEAVLGQVFLPSLLGFLKFTLEIAALIVIVLLIGAGILRLSRALFSSFLKQ